MAPPLYAAIPPALRLLHIDALLTPLESLGFIDELT